MLNLDRWGPLALLLAVLSLSGCQSVPDTHETAEHDKSRDDPTISSPARLRSPDSEVKFSGWSNQARDVERDLGATPE